MQIPLLISRSKVWEKVVDWLIREAKKTPYSHITEKRVIEHSELNSDKFAGSFESVYMERYWLWGLDYYSWFAKLTGYSLRLHYIRRPDRDRHLHDHPWPFTSVVLRGNYLERMPFNHLQIHDAYSQPGMFNEEYCETIERTQGSIASRNIHQRHTIAHVSPGGVWTLFISGKKRQMWGFWCWMNSCRVKIYHSDYAKYREMFSAPTGTRQEATGSSSAGVSFV